MNDCKLPTSHVCDNFHECCRDPRLWFWGSFPYRGHGFWHLNTERYRAAFDRDYAVERVCPWTRAELDRDFDDSDPQIEGTAWIMKRNGWTLLQWYDRSGDRRMGSTAGILIDTDIDADNLLALGMHRFGGVFARFSYGIKLDTSALNRSVI